MQVTGSLVIVQLLLLALVQCTKNWIEYNGFWYFRSDREFTFTEAIAYCAEEGAYIAIVTNEMQNQFLKDNDMFGWIGLTNRVIDNYNVSITKNLTEESSYKGNWYWMVKEWHIDKGNGKISESRFYANLYPQYANVTGHRSVAITKDQYWDMIDPSDKIPVICEWQCESIAVYAETSWDWVKGVYDRTHYVNQQWEYVERGGNPNANRLYFVDYTTLTRQWTIERPLNTSNNGHIVERIFLKGTVHSPLYNKTAWSSMNDSSLNIQLVCLASFIDKNSSGLQTKESDLSNCAGFDVHKSFTSMKYVYMSVISDTRHWCISSSKCSNNNTILCNPTQSPFPDDQSLDWILRDDIIFPNKQQTDLSLTTTTDQNLDKDQNLLIYIGVGCAIGVLVIVVIIVLVVITIRKRKLLKKATPSQTTKVTDKPEFKDYSYVCARDIIKQNGANNNIEMGLSKHLDVETDQHNNHIYSLEKIPQVNTTPVNDDISKPNKYSTNINQTCNAYEDIENVHDQNLTDSDKAKAQGLVNNSPRPVKPPRTFAHESVYSEEESPPPPVPSKGILDSCTKTVFDNVVFEKDEGHDIELFENKIYETNVTK